MTIKRKSAGVTTRPTAIILLRRTTTTMNNFSLPVRHVNGPPLDLRTDFLTSSQAASALAIPPVLWRKAERTGRELPMPVCNVGVRLYSRSEIDAWHAAGCPPLRDWHQHAPRRPDLHAEDVLVLARLFRPEGGGE